MMFPTNRRQCNVSVSFPVTIWAAISVCACASAMGRGCSCRTHFAMASILFRTFGFLLILFVVIYIGMQNTHQVAFRFDLLMNKPAQMSAALIYFTVFAVGVIGGTLLNAGGSAKGGQSEGGKSKSKK